MRAARKYAYTTYYRKSMNLLENGARPRYSSNTEGHVHSAAEMYERIRQVRLQDGIRPSVVYLAKI